MNYPCAKFGGFSFKSFWFYRADRHRQTDRSTDAALFRDYSRHE